MNFVYASPTASPRSCMESITYVEAPKHDSPLFISTATPKSVATDLGFSIV